MTLMQSQVIHFNGNSFESFPSGQLPCRYTVYGLHSGHDQVLTCPQTLRDAGSESRLGRNPIGLVAAGLAVHSLAFAQRRARSPQLRKGEFFSLAKWAAKTSSRAGYTTDGEGLEARETFLRPYVFCKPRQGSADGQTDAEQLGACT